MSNVLRRRIGLRLAALPFLAAFASMPLPAAAQAVSPWLYGINLWDGNQQGQLADRVWGRMREAGIRLVRIGGIQYNDQPAPVATYARWIDSIRAAGAEPLVQVSAIEGADAAAALVTELNGKRKYAVKYWAIGNEPTCGKGADAGTVAGIAANIKARASAMKAADPSIFIFIGDECYWRPELYNPLVGGDQDVTGKDAAGRWYADAVAFHTYPFPGANQNTVYTRQQVLEQGVGGVRSMLSTCKDAVAKANQKQGRAGESALQCALTEFNVTYWNSSDNSPAGVGASSFLNGHFFAEVYGAAREFGTYAVLPWSMMQSGGDGSGDDLGLFDERSGAVVPRPSYHHLSLMSRHMRGTRIEARSSAAPVKAFATRSGDTVAVMILNETQGAGAKLTVVLNDVAPAPSAGYQVFLPGFWSGEAKDTLPGESTLLLKLVGGKPAYRAYYDLAMARQYKGPTEEKFTVGLAQADRAAGLPMAALRGRFLEGPARGAAAELRTLDGALAASARSSAGPWRIDVSALAPAAYLLTVRDPDGARSRILALPGY